MKSFKLALIISATVMAVSQAHAVTPKNEDVQEAKAVELFKEAKTNSEFKAKCEKEGLFQFAQLAATITANPKSAFSIEKSGKYNKLAAAIKARFSIANLREALNFAKS